MTLYMETRLAHVRFECDMCGVVIKAINHGHAANDRIVRAHSEWCIQSAPSPPVSSGAAEDS